MPLVYDPIVVLNLVFDLIILGLGLYAYARVRLTGAALIGVGFGFYAISYILTILGYGSSTLLLLPIRVLGYLSVIAGLALILYHALSRSSARAPSPT